jgi:ferredoxin-NADP reductase
VLVEGPFGAFTAARSESRKVLLIAGGVGITPLRPLAEAMAREGRDVRLLYRCHDGGDVILGVELERLRSELGVRVDFLFTEGREGRGSGPITASELRSLVPDVRERAAYVCGPTGLARGVRESLADLGLAPDMIHTEAFRF